MKTQPLLTHMAFAAAMLLVTFSTGVFASNTVSAKSPYLPVSFHQITVSLPVAYRFEFTPMNMDLVSHLADEQRQIEC